MSETRFPRLEAAIVFAHGLLGFDTLRLAGMTLATYFKHVPEVLERAGNTVVVGPVAPTGSIERRAETLRELIRDRVGDRPVHIVGHSMGGLDARHMITHLDMEGQVVTLTTLGTPHRGTAIADLGIEAAESYGLLPLWRLLRLDDGAFHDLSTSACRRFNERTPDADPVRYFSIAGVPPPGTMPLDLVIPDRILAPAEGPNDGLVSVESARWGEFLGVWPCDHVAMLGWRRPWDRLVGRSFDVVEAYGPIVERMAAAEVCRAPRRD